MIVFGDQMEKKMKFTKSELYFIVYVVLTIASAFLDFNDAYSEKLKSILSKIADKTDEETRNGN